jgi:hypothetical protein
MSSCQYGNESLGSVKGRKFLYLLCYYELLKKDPAHGVTDGRIVYKYI